jgi:hypothetical protein
MGGDARGGQRAHRRGELRGAAERSNEAAAGGPPGQGLSRRVRAAKAIPVRQEGLAMTAIIMILVFLVVIGVMNRLDFGRVD